MAKPHTLVRIGVIQRVQGEAMAHRYSCVNTGNRSVAHDKSSPRLSEQSPMENTLDQPTPANVMPASTPFTNNTLTTEHIPDLV